MRLRTINIFKHFPLLIIIFLLGCNQSNNNKELEDKLDQALIELDSIKNNYQEQTLNNQTKLESILDSISNLKVKNEDWLVDQYQKLNESVFLVYAKNDTMGSQGTSFLVGAGGICVSNFHVFDNMTQGFVKNSNDEWFNISEILDHNEIEDYIIFKIDLNYSIAKPLVIAQSNLPRIGEKCFAIGNPKGLENTLSEGIISSIRDDGNTIQMTTEITHGSSGGPLFNKKGEVIGITSRGKGEANLNFAINIHSLNLNQYIQSSKAPEQINLITSSRSFFYNSPNQNNKAGSYVVSGDIVYLRKKKSNFVYVSYTNPRTEVETRGWLKQEDLTSVQLLSKGNPVYYKVITDKAYFHNGANQSEKNSIYIIENEIVSLKASIGNYAYLVYHNKRNKRSSGWINLQDFEKLNDNNPIPFNKSETSNTNIDERISQIKQRFTFINSNGSYEIVTREFSEDGVEGVRLTGYFEGKELQKLIIRFFDSNQNEVNEFYLWDGELFFTFSKKTINSKVFEDRYYVTNNKLIRWIKSGGIEANPIELMNMENEFIQSTENMIKMSLENL